MNADGPNRRKANAAGGRAFRVAVRLGAASHAVRTRLARSWNFVPQVVAYPSYGTTNRVRVLGRVLLASPVHGANRGLRGAPAGTENIRGWRAFTGVPIQNSPVDIEIGGTVHQVHADPGGLVDTVIDVQLGPGWQTAVLRAPGTAAVEAPVFVVSPATGLGIVSDIDDTVMVTALPRPLLAVWNTFVLSERARTPTPGMAVLMDRLFIEHPKMPVIYLSTGPWNAAPAIARFLARNLYPAGTLLLTDWGLTQDRWFRSGVEHKQHNLERLATEFPGVRWILIGDDGQHDEGIYARFCRLRPDHVAAVVIRQLSPSEAVLAGGRAHDRAIAGAASAAPWIYAPDGAEAARQLKNLGLI
jgi:phosphatidate phosphatase APP1